MTCKGAAREPDTEAIIRAILKVCERRKVFLWCEWLESHANPADWPSRMFEMLPGRRREFTQKLAAMGCRERSYKTLPRY